MQQVSLGKAAPIRGVIAIAHVTTTVTGVTLLTTVIVTTSVTRHRHHIIITQKLKLLGIATVSVGGRPAAGNTVRLDSCQGLPAVTAGAALQFSLKLLTLGTDTDRFGFREIFRRTGNTFHCSFVAVLAEHFALFLLENVNQGAHFDTFAVDTVGAVLGRSAAGNTDRRWWVRNLLRRRRLGRIRVGARPRLVLRVVCRCRGVVQRGETKENGIFISVNAVRRQQ